MQIEIKRTIIFTIDRKSFILKEIISGYYPMDEEIRKELNNNKDSILIINNIEEIAEEDSELKEDYSLKNGEVLELVPLDLVKIKCKKLFDYICGNKKILQLKFAAMVKQKNSQSKEEDIKSYNCSLIDGTDRGNGEDNKEFFEENFFFSENNSLESIDLNDEKSLKIQSEENLEKRKHSDNPNSEQKKSKIFETKKSSEKLGEIINSPFDSIVIAQAPSIPVKEVKDPSSEGQVRTTPDLFQQIGKTEFLLKKPFQEIIDSSPLPFNDNDPPDPGLGCFGYKTNFGRAQDLDDDPDDEGLF